MPTAAGEAVILRLLDPVRDALGVSSLGLSAAESARFLPAFTASQGAVFIVGPTGSGKTSTIYAVLSEVNTRTKSIVSVEDPVEFRLDGIKQMQINPRAGRRLPDRAAVVLRSDPDVVFIGEVRDTEPRASRPMRPSPVTSCCRRCTRRAPPPAPMRLIEMGVEPYLVASALTLVASQRLARKLCEHCAEPADDATSISCASLGADDALLDGATVRRAVGCPACRNTGYRGRLPIFEIMPITEGISRLILDRASRAQIEDLAVEEGMDTMLRAAIDARRSRRAQRRRDAEDYFVGDVRGERTGVSRCLAPSPVLAPSTGPPRRSRSCPLRPPRTAGCCWRSTRR